MKKIILFTLFVFAIAFSLNTSHISFVTPLLSASGGSAYSLPLSNEIMLLNPSLMSNLSRYSFSFGYNDLLGLNLLPVSQFTAFVPGINYSQMFAFLTTSSNTFSYIDSLSFKQSTYVYAASLKKDNFNFGFSFSYNNVLGSLGNSNFLTSSLSLSSSLDNFSYSILFKDILNYAINSPSVRISPSAIFSIAYEIDSSKIITSKLESSDGFNYGLGFIYKPSDNLKIFTGANFDNLTFNYIGVGLSGKYNLMTVNYALTYNGIFGNFYNYLTFGTEF